MSPKICDQQGQWERAMGGDAGIRFVTGVRTTCHFRIIRNLLTFWVCRSRCVRWICPLLALYFFLFPPPFYIIYFIFLFLIFNWILYLLWVIITSLLFVPYFSTILIAGLCASTARQPVHGHGPTWWGQLRTSTHSPRRHQLIVSPMSRFRGWQRLKNVRDKGYISKR